MSDRNVATADHPVRNQSIRVQWTVIGEYQDPKGELSAVIRSQDGGHCLAWESRRQGLGARESGEGGSLMSEGSSSNE